MKRRQQGLGYYQVTEQVHSEIRIIEYLVRLHEEDKKTDPNEMIKHNWVSIRGLSRITKLHPKTVQKAIARLKEKGDILEVKGSRNARLFCIADGDKAEYIRKHFSESPRMRQLNNPKILNNPNFHKENKKQRWIYNKQRKKYNDEITLESNAEDSRIWSGVENKRRIISIANKKHWHSTANNNYRYC